MDKKRLLSFGYLFKELPPPFSSVDLGVKYDLIKGLSNSTNKCIEYSIPKGQYARRLLQLPHPNNFIQIVNHICEPAHWAILENHFSRSNFPTARLLKMKTLDERS